VDEALREVPHLPVPRRLGGAQSGEKKTLSSCGGRGKTQDLRERGVLFGGDCAMDFVPSPCRAYIHIRGKGKDGEGRMKVSYNAATLKDRERSKDSGGVQGGKTHIRGGEIKGGETREETKLHFFPRSLLPAREWLRLASSGAQQKRYIQTNPAQQKQRGGKKCDKESLSRAAAIGPREVADPERNQETQKTKPGQRPLLGGGRILQPSKHD